jgi:hypothetical protein
MATSDFMRPQDMQVFKAAAKNFKVYIGVRRTNPASLPFIERPGYVAKRLDCKPKTADWDVVLNGAVYQTAGLVVDPTVVGEGAFKSGKKFKDAWKSWGDFSKLVASGIQRADGAHRITYLPNGKHYAVQMNPDHHHYGCVMFSATGLITQAAYIHGDYDLYAVVPADDTTRTTFLTERRLGQYHARSRELLDVQMFINRGIGRPMVLHGDQEKYLDHQDEDVDFFFPDGVTVREVSGKAGLEALYKDEFGGRKTGGGYKPKVQGAFVTVPR